MASSSSALEWSFEPAINILRSVIVMPPDDDPQPPQDSLLPPFSRRDPTSHVLGGLGDFTEIWNQLGLINSPYTNESDAPSGNPDFDSSTEAEFAHVIKGVKWRDEHDGADLEDNVEPQAITAANLRTRKRAARRARARERELDLAQDPDNVTSVTATDDESGQELESLRRSPDRRAVIANLLGRPRPSDTFSPPTSPSPPKNISGLRTPTKKEWPVSSPFIWSAPGIPPASAKSMLTPIDGLSPCQRKIHLISQLAQHFPEEKKYLKNSGLLEPAFSPLNTSPIGIHVFIDMSNISIGFHDCLKVGRDIPISTRVRRVPMNFHNLSLVLERGRPAAKRILSGSDRTPAIEQAETCGYETNILDRVHKVKTPTPRRKRQPGANGGGYNSASGVSYGETSGSETPGYLSGPQVTYKWSEQAVDEILHLKMSHSILDADKPSTIVLATGDAAEAEYSDGFLRMVERALSKGWMVELVSFRLNTSSLYRRRDFLTKWRGMFKWIQLDDYAEALIDD